MTKRTLHPAILSSAMSAMAAMPALAVAIAVAATSGCGGGPEPIEERAPYVDEWVTEAELPASQFVFLSVGNRISSDNFSNRGNVEVVYEGTDNIIKIEMQRFTVASSPEAADTAFAKMKYWGYNISSPEKPSTENEPDLCDAVPADPMDDPHDACYVRAYYDGLFQPVRDGANFRITLPAGWAGDLNLTTSDNLEEGIDSYPDRSDVSVDGLNGSLNIDLDSGNATVRMDPNIAHYAGCAGSQECEDMGYIMGCGCSEPTNVSIANKPGQASNITVDVGAADNWYTMILENRGTFSSSDDFVCNATIDCDSFADCAIDPDFAALASQERAEVNFPGMMAVEGAGIRISLVSEACSNIRYVEGPEDYDADPLPEEKRGELRVCVGCL
jgi:hypothetical protein